MTPSRSRCTTCLAQRREGWLERPARSTRTGRRWGPPPGGTAMTTAAPHLAQLVPPLAGRPVAHLDRGRSRAGPGARPHPSTSIGVRRGQRCGREELGGPVRRGRSTCPRDPRHTMAAGPAGPGRPVSSGSWCCPLRCAGLRRRAVRALRRPGSPTAGPSSVAAAGDVRPPEGPAGAAARAPRPGVRGCLSWAPPLAAPAIRACASRHAAAMAGEPLAVRLLAATCGWGGELHEDRRRTPRRAGRGTGWKVAAVATPSTLP